MRAGFWALALLWLPIAERTGFLVSAAAWMDGVDQPAVHVYLYLLVSSALALAILAPMGLPSALLCREVWRSGYRRVAWATGAVILAAAVAILSSGEESIDALQWAIGGVALAPGALTPVLPVWVLVCTAVLGILVWTAGATLPHRRECSAPTHRRKADRRAAFWLLALLWLPALVIGAVLIQFSPALCASPSEAELRVLHPPLAVVPMGEVALWVRLVPALAIALFVFSPAGLAVALPCRQLGHLGYGRAAWIAGAAAAFATAALLSLAMGLFLSVTAQEFVGSGGWIVDMLHLVQQLPVDMPVYLAAFNLPLLAVVLLLGRRDGIRNESSDIDGAS